MFRVIEFFAKSPKVTRGHSKWHCWVGRMQVLISISLKPRLYLVPFLRYSAFKNGVTLKLWSVKLWVEVVEGHWKCCRSTDHILFLLICHCVYSFIWHRFWATWHWKIFQPWNLGYRSLKVIQTGIIRKLRCSFLFAFHSNYGRIFNRYEIFSIKE